MKIFEGKRFFIYGDGISARAAYRAIAKNGGKAKIYTDRCGLFDTPPDRSYDGAVVSPGIKPTHNVYKFCAERNIRAFGEAEIGFSLAKCRSVGVTGTNGKTTTTRLIADMIGGTACGNIGYPVTAAADKERTALVCELSSFQLYNSVVTPDVAVIVNVAEDHLDWHGSAEEYYRCKCNIAANMAGGFLVIGDDVPIGALGSLRTKAEIIRCSADGAANCGAYVRDGYFWFDGKRVSPVDYLRLQGRHNLKNALCAVAAAKCMGADNDRILMALSSATLSPHRLENAGSALGKRWIDDSKSTNVSSCLAAVEATTGSLCLIVGGRDKGLDYKTLFCALDESRIESVVAMGESAQLIRDGAAKSKCGIRVTVVDGLSDAVKAAAKSAADTVLLSPACASFDEFTDYKARGEKFRAEVKALESK